ncbi:hypothetical protein FOA52_010923 [Chlamydomonas sp. UWO 241]|nr:hypothetical protein FOA52_010923 [Chlamydomonas sp. UWO 241]
MLVGLGGNNGTTLLAGTLANKHGITWMNKDGAKTPNFFGSLTQSSTVRVGNYEGEEVYVPRCSRPPWRSLLPMVERTDIVCRGWDISSMNCADAMERSQVLEWNLQAQLVPHMRDVTTTQSQCAGVEPPGAAGALNEGVQAAAGLSLCACIYDPDFIAANQEDRANNLVSGTKMEFKTSSGFDKVVILWTANTERMAQVIEGHNDTAENLMAAIAHNEPEISPSTLYAVAAAHEGVPFINGSPQNTFVPGMIELAVFFNVLIGGDDLKSGQTKLKSVLVNYLVGAGIKPASIVPYNHLGNNDGMNLSAPQTFRSKEISKSKVVDCMVNSNAILYQPGEHPDHCVVIKYVPYVGNSKRAMDEYASKIFLGGKNTLVIHNTCEDSLLAAPITLDLVILAELITRIEMKKDGEPSFHGFHPIAVLLSYLTKTSLYAGGAITFFRLTPVTFAPTPSRSTPSANINLFNFTRDIPERPEFAERVPLVPPGTPVVNALAKQRVMLENILRACVGLAPESNMHMEFK